jgi:hypothetical protein
MYERERERERPPVASYSLCSYLCVCIFSIYIINSKMTTFLHKASFHLVRPVDQYGSETSSARTVHNFRNAYAAALRIPRYNLKRSRIVNIIQSAPKISSCRSCVLTMCVMYAATMKLSNYVYVVRFSTRPRTTPQKYINVFGRYSLM